MQRPTRQPRVPACLVLASLHVLAFTLCASLHVLASALHASTRVSLACEYSRLASALLVPEYSRHAVVASMYNVYT